MGPNLWGFKFYRPPVNRWGEQRQASLWLFGPHEFATSEERGDFDQWYFQWEFQDPKMEVR
jgi:hypothetical protein